MVGQVRVKQKRKKKTNEEDYEEGQHEAGQGCGDEGSRQAVEAVHEGRGSFHSQALQGHGSHPSSGHEWSWQDCWFVGHRVS